MEYYTVFIVIIRGKSIVGPNRVNYS